MEHVNVKVFFVVLILAFFTRGVRCGFWRSLGEYTVLVVGLDFHNCRSECMKSGKVCFYCDSFLRRYVCESRGSHCRPLQRWETTPPDQKKTKTIEEMQRLPSYKSYDLIGRAQEYLESKRRYSDSSSED